MFTSFQWCVMFPFKGSYKNKNINCFSYCQIYFNYFFLLFYYIFMNYSTIFVLYKILFFHEKSLFSLIIYKQAGVLNSPTCSVQISQFSPITFYRSYSSALLIGTLTNLLCIFFPCNVSMYPQI